ncbi:hypothetical protein F5883DRAFT_649172 [Diaporthe sp. PMI_573]|nr:hypothetical protein F5883DRAFT_649172 [Diaporthaceae sp. PMI_573]
MAFPDWLRIVLLVLSFASFLPQLQLLWLRRDSSGISLCYVLFSLVVATELFTIDLSILTSAEGGEIFVHSPASTGDWLNLAQFGTVWLMWALIFTACIVFYPRDRPYTVPAIVSTIYTGYLLISLVPLIVVPASTGPEEDRKWFDGLFTGFHIIILNPLITILGVASLYPQARTILGRPSDSGHGALSLVGLAVQAVLFLLLGLTWPGRLAWPGPMFRRAFSSWFQMVGYVAFDYIIFAVVQAVLLSIAVRHSGRRVRVDDERVETASERDPLL